LSKPTTPRPDRVWQRFAPRPVWVAGALLLCGITLTLLGWRAAVAEVERGARNQFETSVREVRLAIRERLLAFESVLRGGASLFAVLPEVSRDAWRAHIQGVVEMGRNYAGIQAVGFVQMIPGKELAGHIRGARSEALLDYTVWPAGERAQYASVFYVEPFTESNRRLLGYDMSTDPVLRAAMDQARDTGAAVASGKVSLQGEGGSRYPGFVMFLPVYRHGAPLRGNLVEDRRTALVGYVFTPCRVDKLIESAAPREMRDIKVEVYDGRAVSKPALLYDSAPATPAGGRFVQTASVEASGLAWTLPFGSTAAWERAIDYDRPRILLVAGGLMSLLLAVAGWSFALTRSHSRALERVNAALTDEVAERKRAENDLKNQQDHLEDLVRERTAELSVAEEKYRGIVENAVEGIYQTAPEGQYLTANPALAHMLGFDSPEQLIAERNASDGYVEPQQRLELRKILEERGSVQGFIRQTYRRDGSKFWVSLSARAVRDATGAVRYYEGTAEDITDRMLAEENARRLIREEAARQEAEAARGEIAAAHEQLKARVGELEQNNRAMARLGEMVGLLQTCVSAEESRDVAANQLKQIFDGEDGALYLFEPEHKVLELAAAWGQVAPRPKLFAPDDCWAMRLGQQYTVEADAGGLRCRHVDEDKAAYACAPLVAQGEALGLLHIRGAAGRSIEQRRPFLHIVAENLALGLANVRLRAALRAQAIFDPLTGLYNRRFMSEAIERELDLASRRSDSLALVMADVDHFKRLNDSFGHEAGDTVLREIAAFIGAHIRSSDLACRYGGEEILIILPDTGLEAAQGFAEKLRLGVRELQPHAGARAIGPVTISLGVAAFPKHGQTTAELLRAADTALYRAKDQGRDRVVVAM
jgi:diguanylate cyclase (GGDEF)-like protein/PAS domain S-box-containing protein